MSSHEKSWFDEQLRDVPVPEGLLARLKQQGTVDDASLDALAAQVPVPRGLIDRLKQIPADICLDERLCDVPISRETLETIGRFAADEPVADFEAAVHVSGLDESGPSGVGLRRRQKSTTRAHRALDPRYKTLKVGSLVELRYRTLKVGSLVELRIRTLKVGSLVVACSVLYFLAAMYIVLNPYRSWTSSREPTLESGPDRPNDGDAGGGEDRPLLESIEGDQANASRAERPRHPIFDMPGIWEIDFDPSILTQDAWAGSDAEGTRDGPQYFAMPGEERVPTKIVTVEGPRLRGVAPPRVKGFDFVSFVRKGVHPFVSPRTHAALEVCQLPVVTDTTSYDEIWQQWREGRTPDFGRIRLEHFLAALEYGFRAPAGHGLGIRSAAGPSIFGESTSRLLQIAIQAEMGTPEHKPGAPLATRIRWSVRFRPQAVAAYRLVGHEADLYGGLLAGELEGEVRAGETATVLFELQLQPRGGDEVALVELTWIDAITGKSHRASQRISRLQFATSFEETATSLQMATIAAKAARVLRTLPHFSANRSKTLAKLLDAAGRLPVPVRTNSSFAQLLSFVEGVQRGARSGDRGVRKE